MDHREYIRYLPGSSCAVLLLHGIGGSPAHFRELIPVIPASFSVYNVLLDGHGGTVEDFSRSSMKKWKAQVSRLLETLLSRHQRVYIVGHSMGTLFAIRGAVEHPDRIAGLFLLCVPLRVHLPLSTVATSLRATRPRLREGDRAARELIDDCSICLTPNLLRYLGWIPRFWELLLEIRRVRGMLPKLRTPCMSFQSQPDGTADAIFGAVVADHLKAPLQRGGCHRSMTGNHNDLPEQLRRNRFQRPPV